MVTCGPCMFLFIILAGQACFGAVVTQDYIYIPEEEGKRLSLKHVGVSMFAPSENFNA